MHFVVLLLMVVVSAVDAAALPGECKFYTVLFLHTCQRFAVGCAEQPTNPCVRVLAAEQSRFERFVQLVTGPARLPGTGTDG